MANIKSPNKQYTGVSASVFFVNGEGQTDNPNLITWFKEKGYTVIEEDQDENNQDKSGDDDQEGQGNEVDNKDNQEDEGFNYDDLTVDQIKEILDQLGVEYKAKDSKQVLFDLLVNAKTKE